ncbi:hypothetical protein [Methylobacterium trifolii]|uniref:hypothetical protein n=1 Tax=Methylobacterium trifolii TaxID=1003092 RepID=UPI001EE0D6A6|nr:hypothetical protein [Methylobacterium trifolii]
MNARKKSDLIAECDEVFEDAIKALNYVKLRCCSKEEQTNMNALIAEYSTFNLIRNMIIDSETGKFVTGEALTSVIIAITRAASDVFSSLFPMLQYKAFNLVGELSQARYEICLTHNYDDANEPEHSIGATK